MLCSNTSGNKGYGYGEDKQLLLKAGFKEKQLEDMSLGDMLQAFADVWVNEEVENKMPMKAW